MLQMMQSSVDITEDDVQDVVANRVKAFIYIGAHNLVSLANTFNFKIPQGYLPDASVLKFNLYKTYLPT
jgi:hypothetical protein